MVYHENRQLDIFSSAEDQDRQIRLDLIVDRIRNKYGYTKLVHVASLTAGGRSIKRASLVGGHAGGIPG